MFGKSKDRQYWYRKSVQKLTFAVLKKLQVEIISGHDKKKKNGCVTKSTISGFRHIESTVRRPPPQFNKPKTQN